jgi:hypothetical protein
MVKRWLKSESHFLFSCRKQSFERMEAHFKQISDTIEEEEECQSVTPKEFIKMTWNALVLIVIFLR